MQEACTLKKIGAPVKNHADTHAEIGDNDQLFEKKISKEANSDNRPIQLDEGTLTYA